MKFLNMLLGQFITKNTQKTRLQILSKEPGYFFCKKRGFYWYLFVCSFALSGDKSGAKHQHSGWL